MNPKVYQILASLGIITIIYGIVIASHKGKPRTDYISGDYTNYLMK